MAVWEYFLLFGLVILAGLSAFVIKTQSQSFLKLSLSFGGAYILGITFLHLVPEVYHGFDKQPINIGIYILGGFFIQLFLEMLSKGIEHGHIHAAHHANKRFAITVMLGLCIHAFIEGFPLNAYEELDHGHHHHHDDGNHLLFSVILHKIPAAFALVSLLHLSGYKRRIVLTCLVIFASMSPLGALLAAFLENQSLLVGDWSNIALALVIGSFLHIATTILFETEADGQHRISYSKLAVILSGVAIALLSVLV